MGVMPQIEKHQPWIRIAFRNAKRNLLNNFLHVDDTYLQNYLDEFTNRSTNGIHPACLSELQANRAIPKNRFGPNALVRYWFKNMVD
jgi:hypothetical protein